MCFHSFYVFVCALCNHGEEFVRRLQLKLDDLVHLLLYNLSVHNERRYFDVTKVIVPYAIGNWHALQLLPTVSIHISRGKTLSSKPFNFSFTKTDEKHVVRRDQG